jgi:hypothetical protein
MREISTSTGIKLVNMFPLDAIASIKWQAEYAAKIRDLRGRRSRREVIAALGLRGVRIGQEGLRAIEDGRVATITPELLTGLCDVYSVHYSAILPCIQVGIPNFQVSPENIEPEDRR